MVSIRKADDTVTRRHGDAEKRQIRRQYVIHGNCEDAVSGLAPAVISGKFHQTLVAMFAEICSSLCELYGLNRVVCSGGVFQNVFLLENLEDQLQTAGVEVYTPQLIPANDGCISLGQAVIGAASLEG